MADIFNVCDIGAPNYGTLHTHENMIRVFCELIEIASRLAIYEAFIQQLPNNKISHNSCYCGTDFNFIQANNLHKQ